MGVSVYKINVLIDTSTPRDFEKGVFHASLLFIPALGFITTHNKIIIQRTIVELFEFLIGSAVGEGQSIKKFVYC